MQLVDSSMTYAEGFLNRTTDPIETFSYLFDETFRPWQKQLFELLDHDSAEIKMTVNPGEGKTFFLARAAWWWMENKGSVLVISANEDQSRNGIWKELRSIYNKLLQRGDLGFCGNLIETQTEWRVDPDHRINCLPLVGIEDQRGRRVQNLLVLIDNTDSIPDETISDFIAVIRAFGTYDEMKVVCL